MGFLGVRSHVEETRDNPIPTQQFKLQQQAPAPISAHPLRTLYADSGGLIPSRCDSAPSGGIPRRHRVAGRLPGLPFHRLAPVTSGLALAGLSPSAITRSISAAGINNRGPTFTEATLPEYAHLLQVHRLRPETISHSLTEWYRGLTSCGLCAIYPPLAIFGLLNTA